MEVWSVCYPFVLFLWLCVLAILHRLILEALYALDGWSRRAERRAKARAQRVAHRVPVERVTEAEFRAALIQIRPPTPNGIGTIRLIPPS
jgi:hypothetical protein